MKCTIQKADFADIHTDIIRSESIGNGVQKMGYKSRVDWCDSTWSPVTGCLHGCEYCYARRIAERFEPYEIYDPEMALQRHAIANKQLIGLGAPYVLDFPWQQRNKNGTIQNAPYPFGFVPTFHRYKLDEPQKWKKPRTIFVCSMADLFGEWVPDEWIRAVLDACEAAPQHRYLFLTKNPERYTKYGVPIDFDNTWYGTTITCNADANLFNYLPAFCHTFVSIEPLHDNIADKHNIMFRQVDWFIIGAETGKRNGRIIPQKAWVDKICEAADACKKPVFMKESLRDLMGDDFRQEFPWEV